MKMAAENEIVRSPAASAALLVRHSNVHLQCRHVQVLAPASAGLLQPPARQRWQACTVRQLPPAPGRVPLLVRAGPAEAPRPPAALLPRGSSTPGRTARCCARC